ncbi:MAG TPA: nickel-dependent lactate racemase [Bryobacteraceae bacterium]|nr:nickel-dependent lactate racemase [Bryobacteraceae bacterium]
MRLVETMRIAMPFGETSLPIHITADLIEPRRAEPISDELGAVQAALRKPIGTPPLAEIVRRGERVAILVNDITRLTRTDLMLPPIVEVLNAAGIPDGSIFVVFALGIHRRQTCEEQKHILGAELYHRLQCFDHSSEDGNALVEIGQTSFGNVVQINRSVWEADRILLTGEIVPHLIAGYSGGRKSLVPGVAGSRTTTFNHNMIFHPNCRSGVLKGNPAHEDLMEACRMANPDFLVNVVLSPEGKLVRVVAGHWDLAHREGCRTVEELTATEVRESYDLLIASAGGFPLDIDLRQAHKPLDAAVKALRPGGSILFYAECAGGAGHPLFENYVQRYDDHHAMERALRQNFAVGAHKAYWVARLGAEYDVHLVSRLDPRFVERCHFHPVSLEHHERVLAGLLAKASRVAVIPHAGHVLIRPQ